MLILHYEAKIHIIHSICLTQSKDVHNVQTCVQKGSNTSVMFHLKSQYSKYTSVPTQAIAHVQFLLNLHIQCSVCIGMRSIIKKFDQEYIHISWMCMCSKIGFIPSMIPFWKIFHYMVELIQNLHIQLGKSIIKFAYGSMNHVQYDTLSLKQIILRTYNILYAR